MINITVKRRHIYLMAAIVSVAALLIPVAAWASHRFDDVPNTNPFHNDITWIANTGVTVGCGGSNYCPEEFVTREQMAAFLHRSAVNTNRVWTSRTPNALTEDFKNDLIQIVVEAPDAGTIIVTGTVGYGSFIDSAISAWIEVDSATDCHSSGVLDSAREMTTHVFEYSDMTVSGARTVARGTHTVKLCVGTTVDHWPTMTGSSLVIQYVPSPLQ